MPSVIEENMICVRAKESECAVEGCHNRTTVEITFSSEQLQFPICLYHQDIIQYDWRRRYPPRKIWYLFGLLPEQRRAQETAGVTPKSGLEKLRELATHGLVDIKDEKKPVAGIKSSKDVFWDSISPTGTRLYRIGTYELLGLVEIKIHSNQDDFWCAYDMRNGVKRSLGEYCYFSEARKVVENAILSPPEEVLPPIYASDASTENTKSADLRTILDRAAKTVATALVAVRVAKNTMLESWDAHKKLDAAAHEIESAFKNVDGVATWYEQTHSTQKEQVDGKND